VIVQRFSGNCFIDSHNSFPKRFLYEFVTSAVDPEFLSSDTGPVLALPLMPQLKTRYLLFILAFSLLPTAQGQDRKKPVAETRSAAGDADYVKQRSEWFLHGRTIPGKSAPELRYRAYQAKIRARAARASHASSLNSQNLSSEGWTPLGPVPLASDATGSGLQNYNQVSGRATAIAIDPADPTGNTIYIGGAQGGVWQSVNAAGSVANNVTWTPLTDDQPTLSIGSIAIQPGNSNPSQSVIVVGTGEADNSADSYFGLGILRSADGGSSWTLIPTANGGSLSFAGLGGTRMAFSTASGQTSTVVAAMAATNEGDVAGALTSNTYRGLYTSTDAGQSWTYDALASGGASNATSATSVVYNAAAGLFLVAVRYQGFFSSPDGLNWTRLANQPGTPGLLSTAACPVTYSANCPIYRAEISVVPGRNEMYTWFVSLDSNGDPVDQGIWLSTNSGASWTNINDSGVSNCGDPDGCGVEQGTYNLELVAVPNGTTATDLYPGAINLYKCTILTPTSSPACSAPFMNLTHAYGCDPFGAPAHVHPGQHALAFTIPATGADLMYFANDGGMYRALNGFTGLTTGSCTGTNLFDDLNQNLGSMTQFVCFSESATDANLILGGSQDNGSPATATATTSTSWSNVLGGDGGYSAIDMNTGDWFASQPDTGDGTLGIQECSSGINCNDSLFTAIVSSGSVGGDDGAFYFPYILDPQSTSTMLVGTCRVWSGPRAGGAFTDLSLNFDTLGLGTCTGMEVNTVRAVAAGGPANPNGSDVVYATTDGPGSNNLSTPIGGNVWATTNAIAVSGTTSTFANVTLNGPGGASINSNQFPISDVAIDTSDPSGNTAYVTVMGFTGGPGHIWQTTNAGASWIDFTGTGINAIPDSPTNVVIVDPVAHMVYAGTDVGAFQSSTLSAAWTEVGPIPNPNGGSSGFLPDVAVTALAIFNSGGQKLLRASTYGRGVWEFNLLAAPDFSIAVSNTPLTLFAGGNGTFNGTLTSIDGYGNSVALSCIAGTSSPPVPCTPNPSSLAPTQTGAPFTVAVSSNTVGSSSFNIQGVGTDPSGTTHTAAVTLNVVSLSISPPTPSSVDAPAGGTSAAVSFQVSAQGTFDATVTLSCSFAPAIAGATCAFNPAAFVLTPASPVSVSATVSVPVTTSPGPYAVTILASAAGMGTAPGNATFTATVIPNFTLSLVSSFPNVKAGGNTAVGAMYIVSADGFSGTVNLSCTTTLANTCSVNPTSVTIPPTGEAFITIGSGSLGVGSYQVSVQGTSGPLANTLPVPFSVGDYTITGPSALTTVPGGSIAANLTFASEDSYNGQVDFSCDVSSLPGAQCTLTPPSPLTIVSGQNVVAAASVNIPANTIVGAYNVIIDSHDSAGEPSHNFTTAVSVQDFSITAPAAQTVGPGGTAGFTFSLAPLGAAFSSAINLACSGAPASSTCTVTPSTVTPGSSTATVTVTVVTSSTTPQGAASIVVTATSGSLSHSATASLTVGDSLQLAVPAGDGFPTSAVTGGSSLTAYVLLTPNYTGTVTASCSNSLPGTQCTLTPGNTIAINAAPIKITVSINIPNSAFPGNYSVTVGIQGTTQSISLPFSVAQDYAIDASPLSQTISLGQSITYGLTVAPNPSGSSYSNPVSLTCASVPNLPGTCSISPPSFGPLAGSESAVMTIATQAPSGSSVRPRRAAVVVWIYSLWIGLAGLVATSKVKRSRGKPIRLLLLLAFLPWLPTCGSGSNGGSTTVVTTGVPITYTITVTGSATGSGPPPASSVILTID
jgi:hypothetical protein